MKTIICRSAIALLLAVLVAATAGCGCRKKKCSVPSECEHADDGGEKPLTQAEIRERWNQSYSPESDTYKPKCSEEDCDSVKGDVYDKKAHQLESREKHEDYIHDEADIGGIEGEQKAELPQD